MIRPSSDNEMMMLVMMVMVMMVMMATRMMTMGRG